MKTEPLLLLFTREGCHLCERVEETLNELGLAWRAVDIESDPELEARSYTHWTRGLPPRIASGLPGKRVDAHRAGIIPTAFTE